MQPGEQIPIQVQTQEEPIIPSPVPSERVQKLPAQQKLEQTIARASISRFFGTYHMSVQAKMRKYESFQDLPRGFKIYLERAAQEYWAENQQFNLDDLIEGAYADAEKYFYQLKAQKQPEEE